MSSAHQPNTPGSPAARNWNDKPELADASESSVETPIDGLVRKFAMLQEQRERLNREMKTVVAHDDDDDGSSLSSGASF